MHTGTIVRIVSDRGFGFIAEPGNDKDIFFHAKDVQGDEFDSLRQGDTLQFDVQDSPKGLSAVKIRRVAADAQAAVAEESEAM